MPKKVDRDERVEMLAEAARALMVREGAHALSMAKVAREAGVAKATVFDFCSRDQLLDAAYALPMPGLDLSGRDVMEALEQWLRERCSPRVAAFRALLLAEAGRPGGDRALAIAGQLDDEEARLAVLLQEAMERGRLASMPPRRLASMLISTADGLSIHLATRPFDEEQREARLSDLLSLWRSRLRGR